MKVHGPWVSSDMESVMERRMYSRVNLKEPIACLCRVEDGEDLQGFIKNVGLMGVMIEVPNLSDRLTMECCQHVLIEETDNENEQMFSGMTGLLNWIYKDYIGIGFDLPIRPNQEDLLDWLNEHGQLGENVA